MTFDFDGMHMLLGVIAGIIAFSFWRMHRNPAVNFSLFDLVMENGRISKTGFAFTVAFGVTTWLIVDLEIKGKMSEAYLAGYGAMWVAPLVARAISNKQEAPPPKNGGS